MDAKLQVVQAGPSVSIQDQGRPGHLRFGVTVSGAMDRTSFAFANAALDNPITNPTIEISLGGITLQCVDGSVSIAIVGGSFSILLNDRPIPPWSILTLNAGDTLKVRPGDWGSWCYVAFSGLLDTNNWLGSYSKHLKSGVCGTALQQGEFLNIGDCQNRIGDVLSLGNPDVLKPAAKVRAVLGPQDRYFEPETLAKLFSSVFSISTDYDRMGMRLSGCSLPVAAALDMPSEPISRGSIQVPGHGDPICLLAEHHTAGGYPKIATIISADLDMLSQQRTGDTIRFTSLSSKQAVQAARERDMRVQQIREQTMQNRVGLAQRLLNNNLISGASTGAE